MVSQLGGREPFFVGPALSSWLEQVQSRGVKLGLGNIRRALALAADPQASFPSVLVGGTNGKGSTVAFVRSLLSSGGWRVGATTSPHLVSYRERFSVAGELISPEALDRLALSLRPLIEEDPELGSFTFFELGVLLAMSWFREQRVDAAVVEVGMGGEFDATRACDPKVTAVVSVDLDHQKFLGSDLADIAATKARIAVAGRPMVLGESREDRLTVLRREAELAGASVSVIGQDFQWSMARGEFCYRSQRLQLRGGLGLAGWHQGQNAACALAIVEELCAVTGRSLPQSEQLVRGLAGASLAGRLEELVLSAGGRVLLDGAHNPAGAATLAATLAARPRPQRRIWLFASMADKEQVGVAAALLPHVDQVVCTAGTSSDRFAAPEILARALRDVQGGLAIEHQPTVSIALERLLSELGPEDELLVAGSLYLVGDVRRQLGLGLS